MRQNPLLLYICFKNKSSQGFYIGLSVEFKYSSDILLRWKGILMYYKRKKRFSNHLYNYERVSYLSWDIFLYFKVQQLYNSIFSQKIVYI